MICSWTKRRAPAEADALCHWPLAFYLLVCDVPVCFFDGCLGCREACREQAEGRAGDVVEADLVAELDGLRIAAVLAADADLEVGARVASLGGGHLHQLPDASLVERGERILLEDAGLAGTPAGSC